MNLDPILLLQSPEGTGGNRSPELNPKGRKQTSRCHNVLLISVVPTYTKVADLREKMYGLESLVCIGRFALH